MYISCASFCLGVDVVVEAGLPNAAREHGWPTPGYAQQLHESLSVAGSIDVGGVITEHHDHLNSPRVLREPPHPPSPLRELPIAVEVVVTTWGSPAHGA